MKSEVKSGIPAGVKPGVPESVPSSPVKAPSDPVKSQQADIESNPTRSRNRSLLRMAGSAASFIFLAGAIWAAVTYIPPALRLSRISILGLRTVPEPDVRSLLGLSGEETMFSLDSAHLEQNIMRDPRIRSASIHKVFPSSLEVRILERSPVAYTLAMVNGSLHPLLLDETGLAFGWGAGTLPPKPLVSGIPGPPLAPGQRVPPELGTFFEQLARLGEGYPALLSAFSEIVILNLQDGGFETILYPLHARIRVRSTLVLDAEILKSVIVTLDVLSRGRESAPVTEIDARTGTLLYRTKEGPTG